MVGTDGQQAGIFALAAGVGLQAHGVVARDRCQSSLEVMDQLEVSLDLFDRGERMDVREFGPGDRHHLGGGVELHRAGTERDHRAIEGQIAVAESAQVAQHLVLAVVALEHRLREELVATAHGIAESVRHRVERIVADRVGHPGPRRPR